MIIFYRILLSIWSGLVHVSAPFFIYFRLKKGLEDSLRYKERYGIIKKPCPDGGVIWLHGVSVGESLSLLPLIQKIQAQKPTANILVTTTTTAAQRVISSRINASKIVHQFIPFDATKWVNKFIDHWQPKAVFFVESEIWPNILWQLRSRSIPVILLNARLSEKSLRNWLLIKGITKKLWKCFSFIYTQSDIFTKRFRGLGAENVEALGNIKLLSDVLPFHETELEHWKSQIGKRVCWVVASTHQGEEEIIFRVHQEVKKDFPSLLTIVVPRHVGRCEDILLKTEGLKIAKFSDHLLQDEDVLLVDAMAKLGVFYRLSTVAFIGGSLTPIGGHNPLEPAMIGAFPLWGPHFFNMDDMMYLFEGMPCQQINGEQLAESLRNLLKNPKEAADYVKSLQARISSNQQQIHQKIDEIISVS